MSGYCRVHRHAYRGKECPFLHIGENINDKLRRSRKVKPEIKADNVNHPKHYNSHPSGVEAITVTEWFNFNIGNAIKYLWRSDHKGGLEDLKKAQWYINREIAKREKTNDATARSTKA